MSRQNIETVLAVYDAFDRRDLAAVFARVDPEIEVVQSELLPWGGRYRGPDQFRNFLGRLTHHLDSRVEREQEIDADDHVVVVGRSRGQVRATGASFDVPVVHVWQLRDAKIIRFEVYVDLPRVLDALRRTESSVDEGAPRSCQTPP